MLDYQAYLSRSPSTELWEPLWRQAVALHPAEAELMTATPLRRLHYIHHGGAVFTNTVLNYSRLQHTMGVFALISYFVPDNLPLRIAALLHDTGHLPFSHALEPLSLVTHHHWTEHILHSSEVAAIFMKYGLSPDEITAYITGEQPSLLRDKKPYVHCDHLDSWVRTAATLGCLPISPGQLLEGLSTEGGRLNFADPEKALLLFNLIYAEAQFHSAEINVGVNTVLRHLVKRMLHAEALDCEQLAVMNDMEVLHLLSHHRLTVEDTRRWLMQPHMIKVTRNPDEILSDHPLIMDIDKLYLSIPLVAGTLLTDIYPHLQARYEQMNERLGRYYIHWFEE